MLYHTTSPNTLIRYISFLVNHQDFICIVTCYLKRKWQFYLFFLISNLYSFYFFFFSECHDEDFQNYVQQEQWTSLLCSWSSLIAICLYHCAKSFCHCSRPCDQDSDSLLSDIPISHPLVVASVCLSLPP